MDILAQYEKENPTPEKSFKEINGESSDDYGYLINLLMRFSGGRIQNARQASFVLLTATGVIFGASIIIFIMQSRNTSLYHKPIPIKGHELNEVDWPPRL